MSCTKRVWPRIKLRGNDLLRRCGIIYTQILGDLLLKVDEGEGEYPRGFFHTSTVDYTVPNYYKQMWSRDVGRGIMELIRAGFLEEARSSVDYIQSLGLPLGDHYARTINGNNTSDEVDGNVSMLMSFYMLWKYEGRSAEGARQMLEHVFPVFGWLRTIAGQCPYGALLKSKSELSGNPDTKHFIFAVFATYGALAACRAYTEMAEAAGDDEKRAFISELGQDLREGLEKNLISRGPRGGQATRTIEGVWLNGLDERDGLAAEEGDYGPKFDIHRWTRQLPFVQDFDVDQVVFGESEDLLDRTNQASYRYIKDGMNEGYYFRRYGFVSNTCFAGMGDRHDDTMAGYGQNYFSQAALLNDDVNVYTKCLEGIARLAYDGDVVAPLTDVDLNPWVMHECFNYQNYEQGMDHTFGAQGWRERKIMNNPGDEGNLVQSAETLKTFAMVAGVTANGAELSIMPRLPWECLEAVVRDFPVFSPKGLRRISYRFELDREENRFHLNITGIQDFDSVKVRIGPLPNVLFAEKELGREWELSRRFDATFANRTFNVEGDNLTVELINER